MARPELDERFRRSRLHRYLLADEQVIVAQRQHWAILWKPVLVGLAAILVVLLVNLYLPASILTDALWWALIGLAFWAGLKWIEWRRNWMVATDKRVMINYGLINQGVAMFSLSRVPDLTYSRSTIGRLLGYGELEREGTSGDLSLHKLNFVEHPHDTYTTICAAIFDLQDRMFGMDEDEHEHRFEDGPPPHTPGLYAGYVNPVKRPGVDDSGDSGQADDSIGIKVRYGASPQGERDTWYQSPDLHDDDTGPIPYRRSTTDEGDGWRPTTNRPRPDRGHVDDPDHQHDREHEHDREHDQDRDRDRDRDHDDDRERGHDPDR